MRVTEPAYRPAGFGAINSRCETALLAEKRALELLYDRLSPAAVVLLDDYGWILYRRIKEAADEVLNARGHSVLELPTGQGLPVIRKTAAA